MKLPEEWRRSLSEVTDQVRETSRQLGKEAQLQVQTKKLQVEQAKKMHDLGQSTYEWHRSESLGTGTPAPSEVSDLCAQLDGIRQQLMAIELELEDLRLQKLSDPGDVPDEEIPSAPHDEKA